MGGGGGGGRGVLQGQKVYKNVCQLNWNFQRGGALRKKVPSRGEVWIFSGITQFENRTGLRKQLHCMWSVEVEVEVMKRRSQVEILRKRIF